MYVKFCNEAKSCAYWLINETLWYETETFGNYVSRPSRERDVETETTSLDNKIQLITKRYTNALSALSHSIGFSYSIPVVAYIDAPVYADGGQVEDRRRAAPDVQRHPRVTERIAELPHRLIHLSHIHFFTSLRTAGE